MHMPSTRSFGPFFAVASLFAPFSSSSLPPTIVVPRETCHMVFR